MRWLVMFAMLCALEVSLAYSAIGPAAVRVQAIMKDVGAWTP